MGTRFVSITTGKAAQEDLVAIENDLFQWGVLPENMDQTVSVVAAHIKNMGDKFPAIDVVIDSEAPEALECYDEGPEAISEEDLGDYVHFWINRDTGELFVTVIRPDLREYSEPREDTPDEFVWDIEAQNRAARWGEEG